MNASEREGDQLSRKRKSGKADRQNREDEGRTHYVANHGVAGARQFGCSAKLIAATTTVRLKLEQIQLVSGVELGDASGISLQGA